MTHHPHGETVTRLRATAQTDAYSGESTQLDWDNPDELDINLVAVAPGASSEVPAEPGRERLDIEFTLYMPFAADVKPLDRIVVRGRTLEVEGSPQDWANPFTGAQPGTVVAVRKVAG